MYNKKNPVILECGLNLFIEIIQGKWKIGLIWAIYNGIKRPGELQRKIPKASRRVLETQLNQLVKHGLLKKQIFAVKPPKAEYSLTELGESLIPVIKSTAKWGKEHRAELEELLAT